jgi:hypothetical protein
MIIPEAQGLGVDAKYKALSTIKTHQLTDSRYKGKYKNPTISPDGKLIATELNKNE